MLPGRAGRRRATSSPTGPAPSDGELALGRNLLVAFMPWGGYNYEDAILVSERLVKEDIFTSIHIEEFELQVRDTKRGVEEITREIPNVGEEALQEPRRGRHHPHRRAGQGRATSWSARSRPRARPSCRPEEKLLRAIFGEKAGDVKDASLKAPPGHGRRRHRHQGLLPPGRRTSARKKEEKRKLDALRRDATARSAGGSSSCADDELASCSTARSLTT